MKSLSCTLRLESGPSWPLRWDRGFPPIMHFFITLFLSSVDVKIHCFFFSWDPAASLPEGKINSSSFYSASSASVFTTKVQKFPFYPLWKDTREERRGSTPWGILLICNIMPTWIHWYPIDPRPPWEWMYNNDSSFSVNADISLSVMSKRQQKVEHFI